MITILDFLNRLPFWSLLILAPLFGLIAVLYFWLLLNWLELRRRVFQLQARLGPLEAERATWLAQREPTDNAATQTDELRVALSEFQSNAAQASRAAELKQAALQTTLDEAMQRISFFEQREASLNDLSSQVDRLKSDLGSAGRRLAERDNSIAALTQQLANIKTASDSTSGMVATQEKQLADSYRQLSEAKAQLSLYAGRGSSQTLDGEIENVRLQLGDTREKLKKTNAHIAEQLQAIDQLNAELAQAQAEQDRAQAEAAAFEKQIADLNDQIAEVRSAADPSTRQARLAELAAQIRSTMGKLELAKSEATQHEKRVEDSRTQLVSAETQLATSRAEAAQIEAQVSALDEQINTAQAKTQSPNTAELAAAQKAIAAREATIAELKAQLGNTRTSLEMAHDTIHARDLALASAKPQRLATPVVADETAREAAQEASQEFDAAKSLLAARDARVSELEELVADLEQDLGNHKFAWESVNVAMAERLTAVSELNAELDVMETHLDEALTKIDAQNATIADLTHEANAASETFSLQQRSHDNAVSNLSANLQEANAQATMRVAETAALEKQLAQARTELSTANARIGTHADGMGELMKQLEAARSELELVRAAVSIPQANTPTQLLQQPKPRKAKIAKADKTSDSDEDKLTDIVGIGPAYAKRLNKEGIHTFKALAKLKPAQLQKLINPAKWQTLDFESWIEQAQDRTKKS